MDSNDVGGFGGGLVDDEVGGGDAEGTGVLGGADLADDLGAGLLGPIDSPMRALRKSSGCIPSFSMAVVNSSSSLLMAAKSLGGTLAALAPSASRFLRTEDISDVNRAM